MEQLTPDGRGGGVATLERWFAQQGTPPRIDLARSGASSMTAAELLERTGEPVTQLLEMSLDYGPGVGDRRLRRAVLHSLRAPADSGVVITSGAVEALLLLCITRRPRDEVLIGTPAYSGLVSAPAAAGCRVRTVPTWEPGGGLDLGRLAGAVSARTGLVVVNTPHNPTGACAAAADIEALAEACSRHGALLAVDEVARGTLDPGRPSAARTHAFASGTLVVVGDVSKSLGLGGLRVGWMSAADPDTCAAVAEAKDGTTVAGAAISERLAAIALENEQLLLRGVTGAARANLGSLSRLLDSAGRGGCRWEPQDGLVAFPSLGPHVDADRVAEELRAHDVALVPGSLFGQPDRVRLGIGADPATFAEGMRRLGAVLETR